MATVTYHHQPGIHATRGTVPLAGTAHVYKVEKLLWPKEVEEYIRSKFIGRVLHVCSGMSQLGDVRLDRFQVADVRGNMTRLPFASRSFDTVLCDPPYNGKFQEMHDLLNELHRVALVRVVFQHWFSPVNKDGLYKKAHAFELRSMANVVEMGAVEEEGGEVFRLTDMANWMPRTYFGRMQIISTFDRVFE